MIKRNCASFQSVIFSGFPVCICLKLDLLLSLIPLCFKPSVCVCVCQRVEEGEGSQRSCGLTKSILWCDKREESRRERKGRKRKATWKDQKGRRRRREVSYASSHISSVCMWVLEGSLADLWPTTDSLVETVSTQAVTSAEALCLSFAS